MLGRIADSLYWMARYSERAESTARILDVGYRMTLMPQDAATRASVWSSTLEIAGCQEAYAEKYGGEVRREDVIRFLAIDPDNPWSLYGCLRAARENARALRSSITIELWEAVNSTWLEIRDMDENALLERGYRDLFDWVKERANLFHGVADGTMLHDDAYAFMRLGWYLERAGNTARILDSKYHVLLASAQDVGGAVDYYQWGALLRSVSAFRAYHKVYSNVIVPARVAELLILREDMPRSLHSCLNQAIGSLDHLCGRRPFECRRIAGELHARIRFASMSEIFTRGLHEFLTDFVDRTTELGGQVQRDFMMLA
jgi:uncharacterized alpha-E superfamily protein